MYVLYWQMTSKIKKKKLRSYSLLKCIPLQDLTDSPLYSRYIFSFFSVPTIRIIVEVVTFYWGKINTVDVLAVLTHSPSSLYIILHTLPYLQKSNRAIKEHSVHISSLRFSHIFFMPFLPKLDLSSFLCCTAKDTLEGLEFLQGGVQR